MTLEGITSEQIDILQHSLGISKQHDKPYRNYYAVYDVAGSDAIEDLDALVKAGLMAKGGKSPVNSCMVYYYVTDEGRKVAFEHLPKDMRTRGQKRYERFQNAKDAFPDLTFKQFLTDPYFKEDNQ